MENFVIKDTNDFNMYLMKLISDDNNESDINNDNKCLITNDELNENYVKMNCGHHFNYIPLINEFINQKLKDSQYEVTRLRQFELKCPYCRSIQKGTIPYYPTLFNEKIRGINWPPSKLCLTNYCKAIFKSGKRKGEMCNKKCFNDFCKRHSKTNSSSNKQANNQVLCIKILKSGKRKGEMCNCKCKTNESIKNKLCKRHLKI